MNIKLLISCPICAERGFKMNLAQVLPDGRIAVRRFDENSTTVIGGENMYIQCGLCGSVCFRREENAGTLANFRWQRVSRVEFGTIPGSIGAGSN